MKPKPFSELAELTAPKTIIDCVEGKLTALYPPKKYASGQRKDEQYQNGEITSEGLKVFLKIDSPDLILPTSKKGSIIRIESKQGSKGATGLYYEVGEYNGKETRTLKLTATAIISWPHGSDSGASEGSGDTKSHTPRQDAPQRPPESNAGHPEERVCFDTALADYKRAFCKVCEAFGHQDVATNMAALTPEKLAEITTCVSMASTRGQYGRYIGYWFADGGNAPAPKAEQKEHTWEGDKPAPKVQSWEEFTHPKSGLKLKDLPPDKFMAFVAWALTWKGDAAKEEHREGMVFQSKVLEGMKAKGLTIPQVFKDQVERQEGWDEQFNEVDLECAIGERFSRASAKLSEAEWLEALAHLKELVKAAKDSHAQQEQAGGDDDIPF